LKNFSTCLLSWSKFTSQLDAPGFMDCCTWSSAPTVRSGRRSSTRHTRANAHAQRRAAVWRGRGRQA
jgi:hypothetical protein